MSSVHRYIKTSCSSVDGESGGGVAAAVAMLEAEAVVLDGACVCARGGGTQVQVSML